MVRSIGITVGLCAALVLAASLGVFGFVALALVVPGLFVALRKWAGPGAMSMAAAVLAVALYYFYGWLPLLGLALAGGLPVAALYYAERNKLRFLDAIGLTGVAQGVGLVLVFAAARMALEASPLFAAAQAVAQGMLALPEESVAMFIGQLQELAIIDTQFAPPFSEVVRAQILMQTTDLFHQVLQACVPPLVAVTALFSGIFGVYVSRKAGAAIRGGHKLDLPPFKDWYLPRQTNLVMGLTFVISFLLAYVGMPAFGALYSVAMCVALAAYTLQGIAALAFFFRRKRVSGALTALLCMALAVVFPYALFVAGLMEQFLHLRLIVQLHDRGQITFVRRYGGQNQDKDKEDSE